MFTELRVELLKLIRKPRTYIGPVAMGLLIAAVLVGLKHGNEFEHMRDRLLQDFIITGSFVNAAFLTRYLLEGIVFTFLPLFACMVCGDLMASEAADGTLRTLLCRPVTRLSLALSKYLVGIVYTLALTLGTGLVAYLAGLVFLGKGSLIIHGGGIWILPEREAVVRLAAAYALIAAAMVAVGSISFAVSTFLSNSNGAIAVAIAILYGSVVVQEIEYFAPVKPFLLTTHLDYWRKLFLGPVDMGQYGTSLMVMAIYSLASLAIGVIIFQRKDVLS